MGELTPLIPGDLLLYIGLPDRIALLRGISALELELSPTVYSRRYFDESEATVDLVGTLPRIGCEIELFSDNPAHEYLLRLFKSGAAGDKAALTLYIVDRSAGVLPCPCLRRQFSLIPKALRMVIGDKGLPAYKLLCEFDARGPAEPGSAVVKDSGQTIEYHSENA